MRRCIFPPSARASSCRARPTRRWLGRDMQRRNMRCWLGCDIAPVVWVRYRTCGYRTSWLGCDIHSLCNYLIANSHATAQVASAPAAPACIAGNPPAGAHNTPSACRGPLPLFRVPSSTGKRGGATFSVSMGVIETLAQAASEAGGSATLSPAATAWCQQTRVKLVCSLDGLRGRNVMDDPALELQPQSAAHIVERTGKWGRTAPHWSSD